MQDCGIYEPAASNGVLLHRKFKTAVMKVVKEIKS